MQREREKGVHDRSFLLPSAEMSPSARPTHLVKSGLWKTERFHKLGRVVVQCRRLWLAVFDAVGPAINQLRSLSLCIELALCLVRLLAVTSASAVHLYAFALFSELKPSRGLNRKQCREKIV